MREEQLAKSKPKSDDSRFELPKRLSLAVYSASKLRPQGDSKGKPADAEQHGSVIPAPADTPSDAERHAGPPDPPGVGHDLAQVDPIEQALAEALLRASRDHAWDAAQALVDELRARRAARGSVVDLGAERSKRERGGR